MAAASEALPVTGGPMQGWRGICLGAKSCGWQGNTCCVLGLGRLVDGKCRSRYFSMTGLDRQKTVCEGAKLCMVAAWEGVSAVAMCMRTSEKRVQIGVAAGPLVPIWQGTTGVLARQSSLVVPESESTGSPPAL